MFLLKYNICVQTGLKEHGGPVSKRFGAMHLTDNYSAIR